MSSQVHDRCLQALLVASTLALSWLGMMIVHESGHVLFGRLSGGTISKVVLHPLEFSRTDLSNNPHPLFVAWGGALVGTLMPLLLLGLVKAIRLPAGCVIQFFAGFCLVVNGIYLAVVSCLHAADPCEIMRHGSPQWLLILFGLIAFPLGLFLWHGLGPQFGFGRNKGRVSRTISLGTFACLAFVIIVELLADSR